MFIDVTTTKKAFPATKRASKKGKNVGESQRSGDGNQAGAVSGAWKAFPDNLYEPPETGVCLAVFVCWELATNPGGPFGGFRAAGKRYLPGAPSNPLG